MSTVHEIEQAIQGLAPEDFAALRQWFASLEADQWDRQIEQDVAAGKLNRFADEALRDLAEGHALTYEAPCQPTFLGLLSCLAG